ncbi:tRNA (adenosine(37)-N6)-threonylcarbamoyltransferase complex dimerization subunit type 1 TsaB [Rhodobacterales bacterium LSUCC0031]|nr:tRNA (adenosine(37)-N6)-threonylcarbamoyltransferase complex dimerization subunit type 1 TsaB [Rhodobacterales bacterium LSUCC0031]
MSTSAPLILAFDTSAAHCAAALLSGDHVLAAAHEDMAKGQAERLMGLIAEVMAAAGADLTQLDAIGVGIGPGNFTGIRISVAAARGLALALGIRAVGVSRLEALAGDTPRPLLATIDARRGHVYLQRFGLGLDRGPALVAQSDCSDWTAPDLRVCGDCADAIATQLGAAIEMAPANPAPAIARIAARRFRDPGLPRPAPLYLRSPDAAPARESGPVMLPR